ncbi:MAG: hypothetical protein ACRELA_01280, partial [Candidatus Rokuibacteriota bacterium]
MRILASVILCLVALVGGAAPAWGQAGWYVIPSLTLSEEYDDNIFGQSSGRQSDFITRITPGITAGYQSAPLTILGNYSVGAAIFAGHSELNDIADRQQGGLTFRYLPTQRLTLGLNVSYSRAERSTDLFQGPP